MKILTKTLFKHDKHENVKTEYNNEDYDLHKKELCVLLV